MNKIDNFIYLSKETLKKDAVGKIDGEKKRFKLKSGYSFNLYYDPEDDQLFVMAGKNGVLQGAADINKKAEKKHKLIAAKQFIEELIRDEILTYEELEKISFQLI